MADPKQTKLTPLQRNDIIEQYYTTTISQRALAAKYGVNPTAINKILSNVKLVKKFERKVELRKERAKLKADLVQLKALESTPDAIDQIIKISKQRVTKDNMPYQYVIQNACVELLNRAGVKSKVEEEDNEIVIRFAGNEDIKLGMPDD
jgi:predicted DNA-binding protein YlxM (UPF0122 family)